MLQTGWVEKRRFERIEAAVKVTYRVVERGELVQLMTQESYRESTTDVLPDLAQKSSVFRAITRDLSLGGLSLVGEEKFPLGVAVAIHLYLPGYPAPVTLIAEVVRSEEIAGPGGPSYRAGLKILAVNRDDVVRLEKYLLAEKLKKNARPHEG